MYWKKWSTDRKAAGYNELELQMKVHPKVCNHGEGPYCLLVTVVQHLVLIVLIVNGEWRFQPGEGQTRGHLRDCEIFLNPRFKL